MSSEYRDEFAAAEERLARLDAARAARDERTARGRRAVLMAMRAKSGPRFSDAARAALTVASYVAPFVALSSLQIGTAHPTATTSPTFIAFVISALVMVGGSLFRLASHLRQRAAQKRIDEELRALQAPRPRIVPTTLSEIHARIADLEEEEVLAAESECETRSSNHTTNRVS
jgi:hypothetical protein